MTHTADLTPAQWRRKYKKEREEFGSRGCGFVKPDGTWIPCAYGEHRDLADDMPEHTLMIFSDYQDWGMQPKEWYTILDGYNREAGILLTDAQAETIHQLATQTSRPELIEALDMCLETYGKDDVKRITKES